MENHPVAKLWENYVFLFNEIASERSGPKPSDAQLKIMRNTFYAGMYAAHHIGETAIDLIEKCGRSDDKTRRALRMMASVSAELEAFQETLRKGG